MFNMFKEIKVENYSKFMTSSKPQVQEAQSSHTHKTNSRAARLLLKLQKTKDKGTIFQEPWS